MDKAFEIQRAARQNVQDVKTYMTDLSNWEKEMRKKEAALQGKTEQDLPPVRTKIKKEKPLAQVTKKLEQRISGGDYSSWDKFDVEAACEQVKMADVGPTSLDSRRSQETKLSKLREEAQYEKNRGNNFVKQEKWDEAVKCYNRAIELVKDDAIYYANRGLCHLKKERLNQAESDCTEAIKLDPTYVKAYQRRSAAREKLGNLRSASHDLATVLELEPNNSAAKKLLQQLKQRIGTKGGKFKSSPATTPSSINPPELPTGPRIVEIHDEAQNRPKIVEIHDEAQTRPKIVEIHDEAQTKPKIVEIHDEPPKIKEVSSKVYTTKEKSTMEKWMDGTLDGAKIIQPVNKPPHLRSKKPLCIIPIEEIELGETLRKESLNHKILPSSPENGLDGTLKPSEKQENTKSKAHEEKLSEKDNKIYSSPFEKSSSVNPVESKREAVGTETNNNIDKYDFVPPTTCVQFISEWRSYNNNDKARIAYLKIISPERLPRIFLSALESDVLSDILRTLNLEPQQFDTHKVSAYLHALTNVQRFGALALFLSSKDKQVVKDLLQYCKDRESCNEDELNDLRNKFEL